MERKISEIVITGGPCSGKSEALKVIPERLKNMGYDVVILREVAEEIFTNVSPGGTKDIRDLIKKDLGKLCAVQEQIFLEIMTKLEIRRNLAKICGGEKSVILLDRGPMDALAYMPHERFFEFSKKNGFSVYDTRDSFDGVVHLVTAADGAEDFYEQNEVRIETPQKARKLDKETQWAWVGAPHLRIIDNSTSFNEKMERLFQAILRILGDPEPLEIERKFLLSKRPDFRNSILRRAEHFFIEQMYLVDGISRIRKRRSMGYGRGRSQGDSTSYYLTRKVEIAPMVRREEEEVIPYTQYEHSTSLRDPNTWVTKKNRYCFIYKNQYFELDVLISPEWARGMWLLEVELLDVNDLVELPPFLEIEKEVTDDPTYSGYEIAKSKLTRSE